MAPKRPTGKLRAIGYARVSTEEQGRSGLGLEAQQKSIRAACKERGWALLDVEQDVMTGKSTRKRPGFDSVRERLRAGDAEVLVAAKLDRLSRSVLDFGELLCEATDFDYAVRVIDPDVDLSTPNGRLVARVICSVAEWEREMISAGIRRNIACHSSGENVTPYPPPAGSAAAAA